MAVITPNTDVILLKVPLEMDEVNQLTFASKTAQYNYFSSLPKYVIEEGDFTYQRKDNTIRFPAQYDNILQYNYVMYKNTNYSDKWFYAYIVGIEYLNDNVTAIAIKTDVWQTWQFDLTYKPVFVEREHVNDDTVGLHTIPENLETGEYVNNGTPINADLNSLATETNVCWICFQVSDYPDGAGALNPIISSDVEGRIYGGVYSGLTYLFVLSSTDANRLIQCYDLAAKSNAIVSIFHVPLGILNSDSLSIVNHDSPVGNITIGTMPSDSYVPINIETITLTKPSTLDSYTPKNNKLKTWPFSYFYVSNNAGTDIDFRWEDFSSSPSFAIDGIVSQGMSIKAYPTNYKNTTNIGGYDYGISGGKLPICAWNSDYYVNWCTQNSVNQALSISSSVIGGVIGTHTNLAYNNLSGAASSITGTFFGIANAIARQYEASLTPDQARGNENCGDINVAEKRFGYTFYPMSIKAEYAKICDDFLSAYGYKVNSIKIPNITGRRNWNYVKTIGCYIDADIPQGDLDEIKGMFDRGITFWHNPTTFADYTQNNDII